MPELDEMGTRIDDLENNVADLMTQAGMEDHHKSKQVHWFYLLSKLKFAQYLETIKTTNHDI